MFDIGWSEMAVIALIALIIIGPKELPKAMRSLAKWTRKARGMAREFQSGIDDMVREADLEDTRKAIESAKSLNIGKAVEETIDPTGGLRDEAREFKADMAREVADDDGAETAGAPGAAAEAEAQAAGDAAKETEDANAIEHPATVAPPEPEPEPEPATVGADGEGAKQPART